MTDARLIPPCVVCGRRTCADAAACRSHLLYRHRPDDSRSARATGDLGDDFSDFVITPAEWRRRAAAGAVAVVALWCMGQALVGETALDPAPATSFYVHPDTNQGAQP